MPGEQVLILGRPTDYTTDLISTICERLASGESMRSVSRDDAMPAMSTLFRWLREHEEFKEQYAIAKDESADALVEDMLDIADNQVEQPLLVEGLPLVIDGNVVMIKDAVSVNHARLRVDTRKWYASKLKPKKYGDRVQNDININDYTGLSSDERQRMIAERSQALLQSQED